jgi:predicted dehydrogenase
MKSKLRTVVVGMGPIGNRHADMYRDDPLAELVGVCDILKERADAGAKRLGVPAFNDAEKMFAALKPDVCSVCTGGYEYGSDHFEPTMQALEAGCHVLGEKPISNEIAQAEKMVAKARAKRRCYGINLNHRFTPAARVAKKWMDEGRVGPLLFINMSMWIKNPVESSPYDIERGHPMERCEVAGTRGRFVIDDMWREATLYPAGNLEKTVFTNPIFGGFRDFEDTFRDRIHTFLKKVAAGAKPSEIDGSGADGLAVQKVLQAAIESLDSGKIIRLR